MYVSNFSWFLVAQKWKCIQYFIVQLYQWMPYLSSTKLNKISSSYRPVGYEYASVSLCLKNVWFWRESLPFTHAQQLRNSASIFHSSVPRQQKGSIFFFCSPLLPPAKSLLYASSNCSAPASLHFGHITFTYWILSDSPRRGGKGNRAEGSCGVNDKKKFIFLHSAGCGMSYSFTAGEVVYLCSRSTRDINTILENVSVKHDFF